MFSNGSFKKRLSTAILLAILLKEHSKMLRVVLQGSLEVHGEAHDITFILFGDCMTDWQIVKGAGYQTIRIPFSEIFKPHLCIWHA